MRSTLLRGGILLAVACTMFSAVTFAAPTALPTTFNPDQHVYLTPGTNVSVNGMENQLAHSAVPTFAVFTTQGQEPFTDNLASDQSAQLLTIWSVQKGWPKDQYLVIVAVQNNSNPKQFSTSIAIGPGFKRLGITDAELQTVLTDAKQFVSVNPNVFALRIMAGVADLIAQHGGSSNPGGGSDPGPGSGSASGGNTRLIVGGVVLAGLVLLGLVLFFRRPRA